MIFIHALKRGWGIVAAAGCAAVLASCGAQAEQNEPASMPSTPTSTTTAPTKTEAVTAGLQVGEHVNPFDVEDITGPKKGKQLCYV